MDLENSGICPVCTLYLRPGITLKSHLNSHPKQKVIEALVNLTNLKIDRYPSAPTSTEIAYQPQFVNRNVWNQPSFPSLPMPPTANHSFIYQQFMSTSQPPLNQQYVTVPSTAFNSSMMCPPYLYQQQQQVFMSSSALPTLVPSKSPVIDLSLKEDISEEESKEVVDVEDDVVSKIDSTDDDHVSETAECEPTSPFIFENEVNEEEVGNMSSPGSSSSDYLRIRQDLNKACQTRQEPDNYEELDAVQEQDIEVSESYEYYPDGNINVVHANNQVVDLNGVQLVLYNDFVGRPVISQVHEFECNSTKPNLTSIGTSNYDNVTENLHDDSISRESGATHLSIRANENMPPRGELSGQGSSEATSDVTWNRVQHENNSVASCDLFARETWDGSDGSDYELPPLQSRPVYREEMDDTPTIISVIEPPLNFKCPTCGNGFKCPKERKAHQAVAHNKSSAEKNKSNLNVIGAKVPIKTSVKKLVIKPKKTVEIKNENNFEEVFKVRVGESKIDDKNLLDAVVETDNKCNMIVCDKAKLDSFECSGCGVIEADIKALKRHKELVHGFYNRYKCDTCGEDLENQTNYMQHLKKHPLECKLCGKYFYRRQNIQLHMKRHLGIKPFSCEYCQKQFFSKQKLLEHRYTHTGEAPIKCNLCDESFRRHSNLVQHRNIHHLNVRKKVKDFICHCGEVLHSKKKLLWHKEIHDAKPKACTKCSEKFVHMASLTRHMRRSHNDRFVPDDRNSENVECPICTNVYLKSSLDAHIRRHSGIKGFSCTICNKEFTTKWNLKLHKWTHASRASKPFKCEHCKAAFIRESDHVAHMNSHKCVRPYTCNHCGAQFIRKSNCQRHVKEHERDKTFTCQLCGKAFHRSYYLKDHMRVHSGVRPFSCHICGKTSSTKSNHNKHVMIHHAKEPVSTEN